MAPAACFITLVLLALTARGASTPASNSDDAAIADAIAKLSDADSAVRDKASARLWSAGRSAKPALQQALHSDDPEVGRRARSILVRIEMGIYPDTPQNILDYVSAYSGGDNVARWAAVHGLANQGVNGVRVLIGLRRVSQDDQSRRTILQAIGANGRFGATLLLGEGDDSAAETLLQQASLESETGARNFAALLYVHGRLADQIAAAKAIAPQNAAGVAARRNIYLLRGNGDLAGAAAVAEASNNPDSLDSILLEAQDWTRLKSRYRDKTEPTSESLGFTAAFSRLTGDRVGLDSAVAELEEYAARHDDEYSNCAECLMLNDRIDEGVNILIARKDYFSAVEFLQARLRFKEALALVPKARADLKAVDFLQLRAKTIYIHRFIGDHEMADRELREIAEANEKEKDLGTWIALAEAARVMKKPRQADAFLATAIALPTAGNGSTVLEKAGFAEDFPALYWWQFLRGQDRSQTHGQTLAKLRELAGGKLSTGQLETLTESARRSAARELTIDRDRSLQAIGQTLEMFGHHRSAERCYRDLAGLYPTPGSFQLWGDGQAACGDYAEAAAAYQKAFELDSTHAVLPALRGWALIKSGHEKEGRDAIELAHLLPLADEVQRTTLEETFRAHGLTDDARRERDIIRRTGRFFSWERCNADRIEGNVQDARGDHASAAAFWEIAFLRNLRKDTSFIRPVVNASVPAMIRKARALDLITRAPAEALAQAKIAMTDTPQDADALIEMVTAFDHAGRKSEADALFADSTSVYRRLCDEYPASSSGHNLLAWAEGRCLRDLDDALKQALRSVELEPGDPEILDTLAAVYFARSEVAQAVEQAQRCVDLAPTVVHYREQLEKYKAAQSAKKR